MANVIFKRGLQTNLPSAAEDGVFYLTTDTKRLYVGINNTRHLLNQTVQIIASMDALTALNNSWISSDTQADHVNDFYYISGDNILAVYIQDSEKSGSERYRWQQINPDTNTFINDSVFNAVVNNNVATITNTLTDNNSVPRATATFSIAGAGGIEVSATGTNGIVLTGNEYTLSRSVTNGNAVVELASSNSTATNTVSFQPGDNVSFSATGTNGVVISAIDTKILSASMTANNGNITLELVDNNEIPTTATLSNIGVVLNNGTGGHSYVPLGDTSSLTLSSGGIYSAEEIDRKFNAINGMTYVGTVGSGGTSNTLPTTGVHSGDTYVVVEEGLTSTTVGGNVVVGTIPTSGTVIGDMFIAKGTEDANGVITSNLQWTYIPSGNDSLSSVTYTPELTLPNNLITLINGSELPVVSLQMTAGNSDIVLSSVTASNGVGMVTTITHNEYTATTSTTASSSSSEFTAITGLTLTHGHVTGIATETFTPKTYEFGDTVAQSVVPGVVANGTRVNSTSNTGNNDVTFNINLASDEVPISSQSIKLISDSIKLSSGTNDGEVVMNMEWGQF